MQKQQAEITHNAGATVVEPEPEKRRGRQRKRVVEDDPTLPVIE